MRINVLVLGILILTGQSLFARIDSLQHKKWALQFGMGSLLDIQSYQKGTISVKYNLDESKSIVFGLRTNYGKYNSDLIEERFTIQYSGLDTFLVQNNISKEIKNTTVLLSLLFQNYISNENKFKVYYAVGPEFGFNKDIFIENRDYDENYFLIDRKSDIEAVNTIFGLMGKFGAEYFISKKFSLHAEYLISAYYENVSINVESKEGFENNDKNSIDKYSLDLGSVFFGLSIYF